MSAAAGSALLLGDIEKPAELALVNETLIQPADIVVAAHHGSRSSSTPELVAATTHDTRKHWVIFSAGYQNRWGFPKEEVVSRWRAAGAVPVETGLTGAVTMRVSSLDGQIRPDLWRENHRYYWSSPRAESLE